MFVICVRVSGKWNKQLELFQTKRKLFASKDYNNLNRTHMWCDVLHV